MRMRKGHTRAHTRALTAALTVLALGLSGCGADDQETATDALQTEILANSEESTGGKVTAEEAGCIAEGTVDGLGVDQLQDYGILSEDLTVDDGIEDVAMTPDDARTLATVFVDCIDVQKLFVDQLALGLSPDATLSTTQRRCLEKQVKPAVLVKILAASFERKKTNRPYAALQRSAARCLGR